MDSLVRVTDEERTVKELKLSDEFLKACRKKIGKSTRYLLDEPAATSVYHSQWKLFAPENILSYPEQGQNEIA